MARSLSTNYLGHVFLCAFAGSAGDRTYSHNSCRKAREGAKELNVFKKFP